MNKDDVKFDDNGNVTLPTEVDPFGFESKTDEEKLKEQRKLRRQFLNSLSPEERAIEVRKSRCAAAAASVASRKKWGVKRRAINYNPLVTMAIHSDTAKAVRLLAAERGWGIAETLDILVESGLAHM